MRISDWSSDVCSSDLRQQRGVRRLCIEFEAARIRAAGDRRQIEGIVDAIDLAPETHDARVEGDRRPPDDTEAPRRSMGTRIPSNYAAPGRAMGRAQSRHNRT